MTLPILHTDVVPHAHDTALLGPAALAAMIVAATIIGTAIFLLRKTSK